jgi:Protein of unknown function (DUF2829)
MDFTEALKELMKGKYAAREAWSVKGEYVVLLPKMQYIWKILTQPNPNAGNWLPLLEDLLAEDWVVADAAFLQVQAGNSEVTA